MIREAIEERRYPAVPDAVVGLSGVLNALADRIDEIHCTGQESAFQPMVRDFVGLLDLIGEHIDRLANIKAEWIISWV